MDTALRVRRQRECCGCYTTIPTMFKDDDTLSVDHAAIARHVSFLIDNGIEGDYGILLAGGAAGDFMTMSIAERIAVAATVVKSATTSNGTRQVLLRHERCVVHSLLAARVICA
eukprot:SAG11_NODE_6085_length_1391_cov_1.339009_3_plen_114_part_00